MITIIKGLDQACLRKQVVEMYGYSLAREVMLWPVHMAQAMACVAAGSKMK